MQKDCKTVWEDCLRHIKAEIGEQSFNTWFKPIVPLKIEGQVLTIQVPSQFFYEYLEEHFIGPMRRSLLANLGNKARLQYSVIVDKGDESHKPMSVNYPTSDRKVNGKTNIENFSPFDIKSSAPTHESNLNSGYIFDNFVEGDCNRLARSAGYAVAKKPGVTSFNPLLLYGGVGLGKTHLVQAVGNEIKGQYPDKFVLYVSSEKFTNQFIEALRNNNIQHFSNYYLQVDTLIIDDVQFLSGKEKTQEIFFHIFNHLHQSGKQIIMTSDCPPRDLKGLQERLLSRFKWGLTADLQTPDFETRIAIMQKKLQSEGIDIPDNVLEYLAYSVDTNIRELEGVLISLVAQASLNRKEIDLQLAKDTLKNIVQDIDSDVGVDFIQKTVAEHYDVSLDDIKSKTRKKEIVVARQVAMYFSKEHTSLSLKSIGYHFGGRDHSTVIHAVQTVSDLMEVDSKFKDEVDNIRKKLQIKSYNR
ncbi:chromosomal replication initiator protein DnaA [Mangrovivirga cuniculi]|uniref:Chromosomal replication initiator protein DnaA n=1 Tax=Mangrovivirga cuniculi TaxID=2715131 RepID=A0A4D7JKH8_9BACT|nr:chromosomal replication initiator protein DnaA [Mangrovivirga cuniculi]QCK13980.1 chromosomal replication initiator protein DnaA [Mangrovivirga cuniculi]